MAINFPDSPALNDTFTLGNKTFVFNGTTWLVDNFVGYTGSQGAAGSLGFTGSRGFVGSQGVTGFTGSQGLKGDQGVTGFTGSQGIQGPAGNDGATGFTGSTGAQGPSGNDGATGFTGSQGDQGVTGFTGSQGAQGEVGSGVYAHARTNAAGTLVYGSGIASVNKSATGVYDYVFSTALPNTNYSIVGTPAIAPGTDPNIFVSNISTTGFTITVGVGDNSGTADVPTDTDHSIVVFSIGGGPSGLTNVYNIWLGNGNSGTEQDFLNTITGFTGSQGIQGPAGNDGATGFTGSAGTQGPSGNDGATGFTGSQGIQGPTGYTGSAGTGGGGALNDLTDVAIASVADGDLLRYNGTAGEWQNTNLGLSVTPTLSAASTQYLSGNATITNWGTYQDPAVFAQLKNSGGTVVVTNDNIAVDGSGNITFTLPSSVGTYTLEVQVQDFGDLASEVGTVSITKAAADFRYWRIGNFIYSGASHVMVRDLSLFTGVSQTGTEYPPVMTANNAPSPYVASAQGTYTPNTSYDPWTAFDSNAVSGWWNLGTTTSSTDYLQIDLGQSRSILSLLVDINPAYTVTDFTIYASNTGAFGGEEVEIINYQNGVAISSVVNIG